VTSYSDFFTASASAGGALTGLLFVALSVSPERLREISGNLEHQTMAATAFTALIDALFVSLDGLTPGGGTQITSIIMGGIGLTSSASLALRLWRARNDEEFTKRWPYIVTLIVAMYAAQIILSAIAKTPAKSDSVSVMFIFIMFGIGIGRSWELLGLKGGGPLDLLTEGISHPEPPHPTELLLPHEHRA
jgi:Kef-type K+ transport system membrane component KefB